MMERLKYTPYLEEGVRGFLYNANHSALITRYFDSFQAKHCSVQLYPQSDQRWPQEGVFK